MPAVAKAKKISKEKTGIARYYSEMLVFRDLKILLGIMVAIFTVLFSFIIITYTARNLTWVAMAGLIVPLGCLFMLVPESEIWIYRPWQSKAERHEKHFMD